VSALIGLWELCSRTGVFDPVFLPPPTKIAPVLVDLLHDPRFLHQIGASMQRIGAGFAIAVPLGLLVAVLANTFRLAEYAVSPVVELIRSIPPLALLPAFLLIFGIGFSSPVAIIVWVAWVPVFINTLQGMQSIDPTLLKAARSMGTSRMQIAFKCVLPAAAPFIIVGLRLALGSAFLVLLAAEMLGANSGLGFYILEASQTFKIVQMYATIVVIGIIAWFLNAVFVVAANRLTPWRRVVSGRV
jgi:NitT/TauT family transport system permease protein